MAEKAEKEQEPKQAKHKLVKKARTVDKWKKKQWFALVGPSDFDKKLLGETVAEKPKNVVGRIIKVDLGQLAGQRQKRHISVIFKVQSVEGNNANCVTIGHTTSQGFLNRLVRRRMSKIEIVQSVGTADDKRVKVKSVALSARKLSGKQETAIRKMMAEAIGVEDGELIAASKGLHLYDYAWDLAKAVTRIP